MTLAARWQFLKSGAVLAALLWFAFLHPSLALAGTPGSNVCIEDGGIAECTDPQAAAPYYFVRSPLTLGTVYSEQALYAEIAAYGGGYCGDTTQSPPYTWTQNGPGGPPGTDWETTIVQSGLDGHCDGGPTYPFTQTWDAAKYTARSCPQPWIIGAPSANHPYGTCYRDAIAPSCQKGQCSQAVGQPIDVANGNEFEREVDYPGSGANTLQFVRTYNYLGTVFGPGTPAGATGLGWSHTYERRLLFYAGGQIRALRANGEGRVFLPVSGGYQEYGTAVDHLSAMVNGGVTTGWLFTDDEDNKETYDPNGNLLSITYRGGRTVTLTYSTTSTPTSIAPSPGLLITVADAFGHQLQITYNSSALISTMTDPKGGIYTYSYSSGLLSSVTHPDTTTQQYLYNESAETGGTNLPYALTGIIDESATRYTTISYNGSGQATSSSLAGGVDQYTVQDLGYSGYNGYGYSYILDPLGTSRAYIYNLVAGVGRFSGIGTLCPACGDAPESVGYDANGNISNRTDFRGNQITYTFDLTRNLETSRTEGLTGAGSTPRTRTITTTWNATFREPALISVYSGATASGTPLRTTAFTYDALGNALTKTVTDPATGSTRVWTYTYDTYGRMLTADGPRTDVVDKTTYAYYTCTTGLQCGQVHTVTDAVGHVTTYNTYNAHGRPLTITDPNGVLTTLSYDAQLRLISRNANGETTSFSYWPTGLLKQVTQPDSSYVLYTYDGAHRLTQINDELGNKIVYTLDAMGNRTAENSYDPSSNLHRTHTRVINSLDQLYEDINAAGTAAVTTTFGYDANGNQTSISAPLSRNTGNAYDELNRLDQITDPNSGVSTFAYDANDNLTSVIDPRTLTTSYTYNGFGDLKTQASPDTGTKTNTYDSGGNLSTSTDARGAISTYAYDALNRVTSVSYKIGSTTDQTISFTYDSGTNGIGRLTGASDANHSMSWAYDALGRVTGKGQIVGTVTKSVGYGYTNADLTSLVTPSGQTVVYGYNSNHQVTSISINGAALLSAAVYEPFGGIDKWTWGNGAVATRTFDTDQKITQISDQGVRTNTYDNSFRITKIADTTTGASTYTYGYDLLDRVTSGAAGSSQTFTYDANGNRLTVGGSSSSTYTVSPTSNRVTGISGAQSKSYTYDAAGNPLTYSPVSLTYNDRGRLKTVQTTSNTETIIYNALGQMVKISGGAPGTVLYMYDEAGHLLGEYSSTGALVEETVWLGDIPVATLRPSGSSVAVYYVHTDHLNTPHVVTRPADNVQMWRWFPPTFGDSLPNTNPGGAGTFVYNLRFPGQIYDAQAGLNQNYFRDYDPAVGRYVESDPIGLKGGSYSTYSYANGNPIGLTDLLGLSTYFGFPPDKQAAMKAANEAAIEKVRNCKGSTPCFNDQGRDKIIKILETTDYVYMPGFLGCGASDHPRKNPTANVTDIGPQSFQFLNCCDLASTLAHEANHLVDNGRSEASSQDLEKTCFNCPRPPMKMN